MEVLDYIHVDRDCAVPRIFKMTMGERFDLGKSLVPRLIQKLVALKNQRVLRLWLETPERDRISFYEGAIDIVERGCYDFLEEYLDAVVAGVQEAAYHEKRD